MTRLPFQTAVGVGLRAPHMQEVIQNKPQIGWFEVHSENYFFEGTRAFQYLLNIREHYPISLHGVGLSLGSHDGIDLNHLQRMKQLALQIDPCFISEHLSWNAINGMHFPDLFPLPYTPESFQILAANIDRVQSTLQQEILIENPSSYIEYEASMEHEADFLVRLVEKTGSRLLIDINNVYVSCHNHGWDPKEYIRAIPTSLIEEIHLAGHAECSLKSGKTVLIDTHDRCVSDEVWALYHHAIQQWGSLPTLIEWDASLPDFSVLQQEAQKAEILINPRSDQKYA